MTPRPGGGRGPLLTRVVAADEAGSRLDLLVSSWLDEARAATQVRIGRGEVTVDGQPAAKSRRVEQGSVVRVAKPAVVPRTPVPPPVVVRFEDEHLAVVVKPAGLVVHAGAGVRDGTLVDALRAQGMPLADTGDAGRPGIVHRLDRGTSGVLVVAKSDAARAGLAALFAAHDVERRYWALVEGVPEPPVATIDAPLARDPSRRVRFVVRDDGRRAVSHYDVVAVHGAVAEVSVRLETGRTHQVRAHLASIGTPVAGDVTYGASPERARALGLARPALHAAHLAFAHPVTGEQVAVTEALPDDLQRAVRHAS